MCASIDSTLAVGVFCVMLMNAGDLGIPMETSVCWEEIERGNSLLWLHQH